MTDPIKVLMVDDEETFRETTKKLLFRRGFETLLAGSGEEAIERLEENPDVVILDIKMPGMDGHQALREIKNRRPELPVIMLTGHGAMPSAREALVEGAFDYLSKPCDMDLLASKITEACRHGQRLGPAEEKCVTDVMIPVEEYTTLRKDQSVGEAISKLRASFVPMVTTSRIIQAGHHSILVYDGNGRVGGILAIADLIRATMPAYLTEPKPSTADSIEYSPLFWRGMYTRQVKDLAKKRIHEIMSPAPMAVDGRANLMEAASMMIEHGVRRLAVFRDKEVVGVIREQDLFFEMERILKT